jgi:hypothetical protein
MGITIEQYLKDREACPVCRDHGADKIEHCVTAPLSREDNCIIYNSIWFNEDPHDNADVLLLQKLRASISEAKVLEYYHRSNLIVKHIKILAGKEQADFWPYYYQRFVFDIVQLLKVNDTSTACDKIFKMLDELEAEHGEIL